MKFLQVLMAQKLVSSMRTLPTYFARTCHSNTGDGETEKAARENSDCRKYDVGASSANFGEPITSIGNVSSLKEVAVESVSPLSNAEQTTFSPVDGAAAATEGHQVPARSDSEVGQLPSEDQGPLSGVSEPHGPPVPPDPETCCESGCVNCVWIKYAEEVKAYYPNQEEKLKEIIDMIEDYNVKMFVKMDLGIK